MYRARLQDTENERLTREKHELTKNIMQMKERLHRAETLVFRMGTPEVMRQKEQSSSSKENIVQRVVHGKNYAAEKEIELIIANSGNTWLSITGEPVRT